MNRFILTIGDCRTRTDEAQEVSLTAGSLKAYRSVN